MKITKCDKCPEVPAFTPADAPAGTLMLDRDGNLCVRTNQPWGGSTAICRLGWCAGHMVAGGANVYGPFIPATGKYLLEND